MASSASLSVRPPFRDDVTRIDGEANGASAGALTVGPVFGKGGRDASREDSDAPRARSASFEDRSILDHKLDC
jgi:hypothetical protein